MRFNKNIIFSIATTLTIVLVVAMAYVKYSNARASEGVLLPLESHRTVTGLDLEAFQQASPIDVIAEFINRAAKTLNQPGWVHVQETTVYDIDRENNGILPDGTVVPLSYIVDSWYHVNDDGLVDQSVSIMVSYEGEALQTSVFANNSLWNSSTGQETAQGPYYLGSLDYHFAADVQEILARSSIYPEFVNSEDYLRSGISIFTIEEELNPPLLTVDYTAPVYAVRTVATFENATGFLTDLKRIMRFGDGSERTYFHIMLKIETGSEPPRDVLTLIEERK